MILALNEEQHKVLRETIAGTPFSANEILDTLTKIYDSNFESDIQAAIEWLVETNTQS